MRMISPLKLDSSISLKSLKKYNEKLCISTQNSSLIILKKDILFLKSDSNYCEIHMYDGRMNLCSKTMKEIHNRIQNPDFIKVHKSYIINANGLKSIDSSFNFLTLIDKTVIPISRTRKSGFKKFVYLRFD